MRKILLLLIIILSFFSCNLGLDDASDLTGYYWQYDSDERLLRVGERLWLIINDDNTGKIINECFDVLPLYNTITLNWRIEEGDQYKKLICYNLTDTNDMVGICNLAVAGDPDDIIADLEFVYYFSLNKEVLYIKNVLLSDDWLKFSK
jgi:hypothetical protein